jgi:hypothetical protein
MVQLKITHEVSRQSLGNGALAVINVVHRDAGLNAHARRGFSVEHPACEAFTIPAVIRKIAPVLVSRKVLPFTIEQDQACSLREEVPHRCHSPRTIIPSNFVGAPILVLCHCWSLVDRQSQDLFTELSYPTVELPLLMRKYGGRGIRAEWCKLKASMRKCLSDMQNCLEAKKGGHRDG